ncbi:hypothetical protein PCE1_004457 [Barthelona sp. PCE]
MKDSVLKLTYTREFGTDPILGIAQSSHDFLLLASDSGSLHHINKSGKEDAPFGTFEDTHFSCIDTFLNPKADDLVVGGTSNGCLIFTSIQSQPSFKIVDNAHTGCVLSVCISVDGSSVVSTGEDGLVNVWSKNGVLRSTLYTSTDPVLQCEWINEATLLCLCSSDLFVIIPVQPTHAAMEWKAPISNVTCFAHCPNSVFCVMGNQAGQIAVSDLDGGLQRSIEIVANNEITSIAISNDETPLIVAGFHGGFALCSVLGEVQSLIMDWKLETVTSVCFSPSGHRVSIATCCGIIKSFFISKEYSAGGQCFHRNEMCYEYYMHSKPDNRVSLLINEPVELIAAQKKHALISAKNSLFLFDLDNTETPLHHTFSPKVHVMHIKASKSLFLVISSDFSIDVFNQNLKEVSSLRLNKLPDANLVDISDKHICFVNPAQPSVAHFVSTENGKPSAHSVTCIGIIRKVSIAPDDSQLFIIDKNNDLHIAPITALTNPEPEHSIFKLQTMVSSAKWHSSAPILAVLHHGEINVFLDPMCITLEQTLLEKTIDTISLPEGMSTAVLLSFSNGYLSLTSSTIGTRKTTPPGVQFLLPYPSFGALLYRLLARNNSQQALRLCQYVSQEPLWTILARWSLINYHADMAERCFAELKMIPYVLYLRTVQTYETEIAQKAEILLLLSKVDDAVTLLLSYGLIYRAIEMRWKTGDWMGALELAAHQRKHVDTVVYKRQLYLQQLQTTETNEKFMKLNERLQVNPEEIEARIEEELSNEKALTESSLAL